MRGEGLLLGGGGGDCGRKHPWLGLDLKRQGSELCASPGSTLPAGTDQSLTPTPTSCQRVPDPERKENKLAGNKAKKKLPEILNAKPVKVALFHRFL